MDVPLSPLLPGLYSATNNMIRSFSGSGILSWLSPKAGLINCSKPMNATVSFQIKDFCDSGVTDLTQYLRVGFRLAFHAIPNNTNEWIANYVSPISEQDLATGINKDGQELNLDSFEQNNMPPGKAGKDTYSLDKEMRALAFLLAIFQKNSVHYIPLSNLHSRISNSGDQELSRYIGSSSLKRRQFIEDRSYIFHLADNDVVFLQSPEVYHTVMQLAGFLLTHGGVTSSDLLFTFFNKNPNIPLSIKETIQNRRQQFMQFLSRHPFAFAPFPSQYYVGVRRNMPFFDYATFIHRVKENQEKKMPQTNGLFPHQSSFPNFQSGRPVSRPPLLQTADSFEQQPLSPVMDNSAGLAPLQQLVSATNPLASAHSLGVLASTTNGFGPPLAAAAATNGHGPGIASIGGGGLVGANSINGIGGGSGGNGSNGLSHPAYLHHQHSHNMITPNGQHQKPLFSLFDEPILPTYSATVAQTPSAVHQNGTTVRSILGTTSGSSTVGIGTGINSNSNGTASTTTLSTGSSASASNNIWKYDMDFFDGPKMSEVFSTLSVDQRESPPRKQFVEREVQTEESSFGNANNSTVCVHCAQKLGCGGK